MFKKSYCRLVWEKKLKADRYELNEMYRRFANIYRKAKARCDDPKHPYFYNYGGRGIKVEWKNLLQFSKEMEKSYFDNYLKFGNEISLDRIDNDKNYSSENCRWIQIRDQNLNRRKKNNHSPSYLIKHPWLSTTKKVQKE